MTGGDGCTKSPERRTSKPTRASHKRTPKNPNKAGPATGAGRAAITGYQGGSARQYLQRRTPPSSERAAPAAARRGRRAPGGAAAAAAAGDSSGVGCWDSAAAVRCRQLSIQARAPCAAVHDVAIATGLCCAAAIPHESHAASVRRAPPCTRPGYCSSPWVLNTDAAARLCTTIARRIYPLHSSLTGCAAPSGWVTPEWSLQINLGAPCSITNKAPLRSAFSTQGGTLH